MKLVVFDLDSTIIDAESLDEFGKLGNKEEEIREITKKAMTGEISFEEALRKRVQLLRGLEIEKIREKVKEIPPMEGAAETVSELRSKGIKTAVISGGFDIVAERIKEELAMDYSVANQFVVEDGKITGEVVGPLIKEGSKGKIFEMLAAKVGVSLEECAAIGDGANDISMFRKAGLSIAFNSKPVVEAAADVVIKKKDLREILPYVFKWNSEEMLNRKDALALASSKLREEVASRKDALKELSFKRRELINSIKGKNAEANEFRAKRDELNAKVKEHKKERDEANSAVKELAAQYKKLQENAPQTDFKMLQKNLNSLEWKLQTSVLEMKKENALVEMIEKMEAELEKGKEFIERSDKMEKHKKMAKRAHDSIVALSNESQQYHEKFLEAVQGIRMLEGEIDKVNAERARISKELDEMKEKLAHTRETAKTLEKDLKYVAHKMEQKSEKELKAQAEEVYERFRKGEKLTLGDIYLLRRFELV